LVEGTYNLLAVHVVVHTTVTRPESCRVEVLSYYHLKYGHCGLEDATSLIERKAEHEAAEVIKRK